MNNEDIEYNDETDEVNIFLKSTPDVVSMEDFETLADVEGINLVEIADQSHLEKSFKNMLVSMKTNSAFKLYFEKFDKLMMR